MNVIARAGVDDLAVVYVAELANGRRIEFVESLQPPRTRDEKWVAIISTMCGCPVGCGFCDAGGGYHGNLTSDEMLAQITWLVQKRFPNGVVPSRMFKIQFARMGEPSLNPAVLDVLERLPDLVDAPGLLPSLSSVAPKGSDGFFERLIGIVDARYRTRFQLQFSLHSTDAKQRRALVPVETWNFAKIAAYGTRWHRNGDRKIGLNFAVAEHVTIDAAVLRGHFDPAIFMIKLTPINPTVRARENDLRSAIHPSLAPHACIEELRAAGYDVVVSIGELEENQIGSNCGQYLARYERGEMRDAYSYPIQQV